MKNYIIFLFIIQKLYSLKTIPLKLCINCKYFIKGNYDTDEYSKCSFFKKKKDDDVNYLINGNQEVNFWNNILTKINDEFYYCSTARSCDNMCGREGIKFEKK